MANNEKIKAEGIDPVLQSYQDTWTSQLFVLGDFHNVASEDPQWADKYTKNQVKYAQEPAVEGFKHLRGGQQGRLHERELRLDQVREGPEPARAGQGRALPDPDLPLPNIEVSDPDKVKDVGFFGIPGNDAANTGVRCGCRDVHPPDDEGEELDAAKKFVAFIASPEGCDAQAKA